MIILMRGIQPNKSFWNFSYHVLTITQNEKNKNFWNLSYPVLTTTLNDEKLHISDSNSLVILSIWTYHTWRDMYRWDECNWTEIVENCNENMQ